MLQVDVAFFTALKAQSVLGVARQTSDIRKLLLDQVTALATNKLRSELDLSFSKVAYEEGNLLVAKAQNDLEEAFAVLSTLLGDREKRAYQLIEEPVSITATVGTSSLIDVALSKRPDLARLRLGCDGAAQYVRAQKALSYPTIYAFGSGGFIPVRDTAHFDDRYAAAGVNLSLPNSARRPRGRIPKIPSPLVRPHPTDVRSSSGSALALSRYFTVCFPVQIALDPGRRFQYPLTIACSRSSDG